MRTVDLEPNLSSQITGKDPNENRLEYRMKLQSQEKCTRLKKAVADLTQRNLDMINHIRQNVHIKVLDERKDTRKKLNEIQPIVAACKTKDCNFKASIDDVSSSGVFIKTRRHLSTGQEIAMKFSFPTGKNTIMATGEIVRASGRGVAVEFKIFFKDKKQSPPRK